MVISTVKHRFRCIPGWRKINPMKKIVIRYCQETWHKTPYSAELPRWHRFRCSEVHVDHESMNWCTLDSWRGARSLDEHRAGQWDRVGDPMPLDPNRCFDFIFSQLIIISWRMKNWHQNSSMQRHAGCGNMSCERQRWQMCTLKIHHLWISVDTSLSPELEELVGVIPTRSIFRTRFIGIPSLNSRHHSGWLVCWRGTSYDWLWVQQGKLSSATHVGLVRCLTGTNWHMLGLCLTGTN